MSDKTTYPVYDEAYNYAYQQQFSTKDKIQNCADFAEWYVAFGQNSYRLEVAWNYWWTEIAN